MCYPGSEFAGASHKPVSLKQAAQVLASEYPEYEFSERQLRRMAQNGAIPTLNPPRGVLLARKRGRKVSVWVRVSDLLNTFSRWEKPAY